ncbi:MAG: carboxypeptidase M32 [Planctomycetota bacterium]
MPAYQALVDHLRQTEYLESANRLLGWDQQTYMPLGAAGARAEQMATLAGLIHARRTDTQIGDWLAELEQACLEPAADANLRCIRRDFEKQRRLPQALVEALTKATVAGQQLWVEARKQDDFGMFLPQLELIVGLLREKADASGFADERYDALLDDYEPGARTREVAPVLTQLAAALRPLIVRTQEAKGAVSNELLRRHYPAESQRDFGRLVAAQLGFDFEQGRIDVAAHPFCEGIAPGDCRITTRYDEQWFAGAFFGTLHEAGHGMYEQGLPADHFGEPLGQYLSLGMHESQSRLWENMVGRSAEFWDHFFPTAARYFREALDGATSQQFFQAVNVVEPSLIRVEADEVTYNLHIVIRFEIERALIADDLRPGDLRDAWNEKYQQYLGILPPDAKDGVLQDVHWSAGLIGYFPTYALGNLYAAQMFEVVEQQVPDLRQQFAAGQFGELLTWLRHHLHAHGRRFQADELIQQISGRPLEAAPLLNYLERKLQTVYGW